MILHQSLLQSWARCPQAVGLELAGKPDQPNSMTVYGSVMHHAVHVLERTGDLDKAIATFEHYWHPSKQALVAGKAVPPDGWLPRQNWNSLRRKGIDSLRRHHRDLIAREEELLALEYEFMVPIRGTDHHLAGTVDRLRVGWDKRQQFLGIDDNKAGQQKWGLRHNLQGTAYSYASLQPEFWVGFEGEIDGQWFSTVDQSFGAERGERLYRRFEQVPRRFTWINLSTGRFVDGGYRAEVDYERLRRAVSQVAASIEAGIFPLNISGETCAYCTFRRSCGVPDEDVDAGIFAPPGGTRLNPRRRFD